MSFDKCLQCVTTIPESYLMPMALAFLKKKMMLLEQGEIRRNPIQVFKCQNIYNLDPKNPLEAIKQEAGTLSSIPLQLKRREMRIFFFLVIVAP